MQEHTLIYYTLLKCILEDSSTFVAIQYTIYSYSLKKQNIKHKTNVQYSLIKDSVCNT